MIDPPRRGPALVNAIIALVVIIVLVAVLINILRGPAGGTSHPGHSSSAPTANMIRFEVNA